MNLIILYNLTCGDVILNFTHAAESVVVAPDTSSGVDRVVGWGGGGMAPGPGASTKSY